MKSTIRRLGLPLSCALLAAACEPSGPIPDDQLSRLHTSEVPIGLSQKARRVLLEKKDAPIGSQHRIDFKGDKYVGRIERHYHAPDSGKKPIGHHKGVSLFRVKDGCQ